MSTLPFVTTFYGEGNHKVQVNRGGSARRACLHAVDHMQMNHYAARVAEVYDERTGELHIVLTYSPDGQMRIVFKRDPADPTCVMVPLPV